MKYQPPFDPAYAGNPVDGIYNSDPDASYINGNPATGTEGSIPPFEAVEHSEREIVKAITSSGLTPSHLNLQQLAESIARYASGGVQATCTGSANDYTLAVTGNFVPPETPFDRMIVITRPSATNIGASVADVFGFGDKKVLNWDGTALNGGELVSGRQSMWEYSTAADGGAGAWLVMPWTSDTTNYRNLPIYPEIETADHKLTITDQGGGILEIAASQTFLWRGWTRIFTDNFTTLERRATTVANKTYHWIWQASGTGDADPAASYPAGRFVLKDVSDNAYNPSALAETNAAFDTSYDTILFARVVTDGSNNATITPLINKMSFRYSGITNGGSPSGPTSEQYTSAYALTLNYGRTPTAVVSFSYHAQAISGEPNYVNGDNDWNLQHVAQTVTRYGVSGTVAQDNMQQAPALAIFAAA